MVGIKPTTMRNLRFQHIVLLCPSQHPTLFLTQYIYFLLSHNPYAEEVGFEPTNRFPDWLISSQLPYNHLATLPLFIQFSIIFSVFGYYIRYIWFHIFFIQHFQIKLKLFNFFFIFIIQFFKISSTFNFIINVRY